MLPSKKVLVYEIIGTLFIIFLGSAFHFTYELSGRVAVVGAFSAVNESVWEHLKLAFWPSLIWLLIEYLLIKKLTNNFLPSKTIGTCTMIALIPIVFYSYTSMTGESIFAIDITTFIVAVIIGQIVSYTLFNKNQLSRNTDKVALIILVILGIAFIVFTFYPPHLPIFQDPISRGYGIAM
jgi:uncharacterized protein with PQ loop repeat